MSTIQRAIITFLVVSGCQGGGPGGDDGTDTQALPLTGSNFEIEDTDANLKVDGAAPAIDWASPSVVEIRQPDLLTGTGDDSFGQGTKEDTAVPTIVDGSIPPNKSDLKFFGLYQEGDTSTGFLNVYWSRVQEPQGTTNMDFEFNQSSTASTNGVTPVRTVGDWLITYDLAQGGTNPIISFRRWTAAGGGSWGPATNLSATNDAEGSINTSPIPIGESDGLGAHSVRTFGEAQIRLSALFTDPDTCQAIGSAYLKSRASDSFTAAVKDFIAPVAVNISNCGAIRITKVDDLGDPLGGAEFTLHFDNAPVGGAFDPALDTTTGMSCTTDASTGQCTIANVLPGFYWLVETVTPPNHETVAPIAVQVVSANQTVEVGPVVNPRQRGAILINKTRKQAGGDPVPLEGIEFVVNGVTKTTDANGQVCFDGLLFGDYLVHENHADNYADLPDFTVTVDNVATCTDNPFVGEERTIDNIPLSTITVTFTSQVVVNSVPATVASIICADVNGNLTPTPLDPTPIPLDDTSEAYVDLQPGTYTCTVVIDP